MQYFSATVDPVPSSSSSSSSSAPPSLTVRVGGGGGGTTTGSATVLIGGLPTVYKLSLIFKLFKRDKTFRQTVYKLYINCLWTL